ncbi:hypothetical protein ANANG_G00236250 [Anguilla anguilla]|uniref:Period circadian-like C-terminal domain-containing protein n=1 Tax=Anguilla anguilla TaxID=7936 RepID=A0A9D3LUC6_ANGAN|nr:hypothetical protein ANANG_G00236250 [Anguilla anguilla]
MRSLQQSTSREARWFGSRAPPSLWGQETMDCMEDRSTAQEELAYKGQTVYSYQQISCLDSVIRYLESCNLPITVKRKCQSSSNTTSSNSDEDKQKEAENGMQKAEGPLLSETMADLPSMKAPKKPAGAAVVGASLAPLALPSKAESVVSITSQCSYSSTIVHVGDKKPQPESEIIEDAAESLAPSAPPPSIVSPPSQEKEAYKKLGLTKQVLAAHTQKEEQAFLSRCREQRDAQAFQADCSLYLGRHRGLPAAHALPTTRGPKPGGHGAEPVARRGGRNKKAKKARVKKHESSDSTASHRTPPQRPPLQGLNQTSWSPSDTSQSTFPIPYPRGRARLPAARVLGVRAVPPSPGAALPGFGDGPGGQAPPTPRRWSRPCWPSSCPTTCPVRAPGPFPAEPFAQPFGETREGPSRSSTPLSGGARDRASPPLFESRCSSPLQLNLLQLEETARSVERQDSAALPAGAPGNSGEDKASACGSAKPSKELQQRSLGRPGLVKACGGPGCGPAARASLNSEDTRRAVGLSRLKSEESLARNKGCCRLGLCADEMSSPGEGPNSDAHSSSSDLLDILLQEDSRSGTGSATSGSLGSGSNGCGTSASGTSASGTSASGVGSCQTSNTSKYFGSIDSSENNHKAKAHVEAKVEENKHFKCVLQEPIWLLMANADESVMMTYQLPSRDVQKVLKEDRERLRQMQKSQPHFSEEQKKELCEVHPWMRRGGLPKVLDVKECLCCKDDASAAIKEDLPDTELGALGDVNEDGAAQKDGEEPLQADACPSLGPVL